MKYDEANVGGGYFSRHDLRVATRRARERHEHRLRSRRHRSDETQICDGQGLKIEDIYDTPVCKIFSVRDLEGNKVSFHQRTVA